MNTNEASIHYFLYNSAQLLCSAVMLDIAGEWCTYCLCEVALYYCEILSCSQTL